MNQPTYFVPMLIHADGNAAIQFYQKAFGAQLLRRWDNEDGSVHVAELEIEGAMFFIRQEGPHNFDPQRHSGVTTIVHLFSADPDKLFHQAVAAGAKLHSNMTDYDYGYRQGALTDPFGHQWEMCKKINI